MGGAVPPWGHMTQWWLGTEPQPLGAALLGSESHRTQEGSQEGAQELLWTDEGMTFCEPLTFLGLGLFPCK